MDEQPEYMEALPWQELWKDFYENIWPGLEVGADRHTKLLVGQLRRDIEAGRAADSKRVRACLDGLAPGRYFWIDGGYINSQK